VDHQTKINQLRDEYFRKFPLGPLPTKEQQSLADRIRRSLSWLERAVKISKDDLPPRFVDLWIALNSLYGVRRYQYDPDAKETGDFQNFLHKLGQSPQGNAKLSAIIENAQFQELGIYMISNKYLYRDFWLGWFGFLKTYVDKQEKEAKKALENHDIFHFLELVFDRLLVLRNQIFHGSSASTTSRSEDALKPGIVILEMLLPDFLEIMLSHCEGKDWPLVPYPGRGSLQHPEQ
jgi:hypothetical protein